MCLIGLLLNFAAITALAVAGKHDTLTLSPADNAIVRYTNESLIVQCRSSSPDAQLQWRSPANEFINEHKGRIHVEESAPGQLKLVFAHIALADKGKWICEGAERAVPGKEFELIVYQQITFTENLTILTVKEDQNATILCEVKGEPQPNVTWYFNGQPIEANSTKFLILADGLLVRRVTQNDTGEYTCRAFQVNPVASDMQERTILMKIEHKPFWAHKHHESLQYAYPNGSVTITCEAIAEPPPNFIWYHNNTRLHKDNFNRIESNHHVSTLTITAHSDKVFGTYKCLAKNSQGSIERTTNLDKGIKPPPPSALQLRGCNSNTFDLIIESVRTSPITLPMEINGYRVEYMTELEFKTRVGNWTNAKRKDFRFEHGATHLISNLEPNTAYLVRAAAMNIAGLSDWTKVEKYRTLTNEPISAADTPAIMWQLVRFASCIPLMRLLVMDY